jgi:hypothetical protein
VGVVRVRRSVASAGIGVIGDIVASAVIEVMQDTMAMMDTMGRRDRRDRRDRRG